jgi:hypothetical protein
VRLFRDFAADVSGHDTLMDTAFGLARATRRRSRERAPAETIRVNFTVKVGGQSKLNVYGMRIDFLAFRAWN